MQPDPTGAVRQWRVPTVSPVLKLAGTVLLVALGLLFADGDPARPVLAGVFAAGLAVWAARDLLAPVRLAADAHGVTLIQGFAGRRRLDWSAIEAIRLDTRDRRGVRSETLEIDTGDSLRIFGRYDLNAPLTEVAEALCAIRDRVNPT